MLKPEISECEVRRMSYVSLRVAEVVWTLASVSEVRKFAKGEVIVKEGDCAAQEYLAFTECRASGWDTNRVDNCG